MKPFPPPGALLAHAAAARSGLTADLDVDRPWLRLAGFLLLAPVLSVLFVIVLGIATTAVPALGDLLAELGPLPHGPLRLIDEGLQALVLGVALGGLALSILAAAALAYRRPLSDFLWPGRRFDLSQFGVGLVVMAGMSVISIPIYLAMGSEWAPPILDPTYLDRTRLTYVLASGVGLLVAAAAEEVVFRGVLLRLTGLLTRGPILLCVINGLLFSAIHLDPDPVAFVARALSGMVWTWAALRLGGIEFVVGAHFAANLIICLFWAPLSEAAVSRDSAWIDLGPEVLAAVVMILFVERLAGRYAGPATGLAARTAA